MDKCCATSWIMVPITDIRIQINAKVFVYFLSSIIIILVFQNHSFNPWLFVFTAFASSKFITLMHLVWQCYKFVINYLYPFANYLRISALFTDFTVITSHTDNPSISYPPTTAMDKVPSLKHHLSLIVQLLAKIDELRSPLLNKCLKGLV